MEMVEKRLLSLVLAYLYIQDGSGCHYSLIKYENGTWCCGPGSKASDTGSSFELPGIPTPPQPGPSPSPSGSTTSSTAANSTESTSTLPPPTNPVIPVGDCVCGLGANLVEDIEKPKSRIALMLSSVRIRQFMDSFDVVQCTGSLLNKRWFITAAHCFCGTIEPCPVANQGFEKIFKNKMERIQVEFGTPRTKVGKRGPYAVQTVIVHPDYWQGPNEVSQPYDVALVETVEDIQLQDITDPNAKIDGLVPICLPPPPSLTPEQLGLGNTNISRIFQTRFLQKTKPEESFEDLDCFLSNGADAFPSLGDFDLDQGFLRCHPGAFTDPMGVSVLSKTSFITAFGSTAREAGPHGDKGLRYQCRTNAYGPMDSMFHDCFGKCNKDVVNPYKMQGRQVNVSNPTLNDPICRKFIQRIVQTGQMDLDFRKDPVASSTAGISVSKVEIYDENDVIHTCFPFSNFETASKVRSAFDFPYKHGWCSVCQGQSNSSNCENLVSEDSNWGWCLPECDEAYIQPEKHEYPHEVAVDAFVYENCSHGINTFKEFCTGAKLATAYTLKYKISSTNPEEFLLLSGKHAQFHPGDPAWNNNGTFIRLGAKYQGTQHTQVSGDACYGDAGGSVWKIWGFRDKEDSLGKRQKHGKVAVLTGVISRFEHHCGFFRPDQTEHWSHPVQHTIHTRVSTNSGSCSAPAKASTPPPPPPVRNDDNFSV
ncbi:uncharacterized protein LOC111708089 [Eurytemora carolleeae]|uniref:uncharacterized protein LOC111708089 n=1 Tax=Eurytemora carolleeae TaxID=1294199 RepID=UPI000C7826EC|nr:uncharacterized protein LOC111708089 [Eurytemora carolleeae]|eukprot:XP_023337120.1 uncharacterized protein LOC111708089 [Eurytemora affinis]